MEKKVFLLVSIIITSLCLGACKTEPDDTVSSAPIIDVISGKVDEASTSENVTSTENIEVSENDGEERMEPVPFLPDYLETDLLTWDFDSKTGTLFVNGEGPMRDYYGNVPEWEDHKDEITKIVIGDKVTTVGAYAFFDYEMLYEVVLPDSIETIGESAFDFDIELHKITMPASLKYVGNRAFYNTLLWEPENLVFPEGCEYIGDEAFHSALKTGGYVALPSSLKYLGKCAFTNSFLSDFVVVDENPYYHTENGVIYSKDMKTLYMVAPLIKDGLCEMNIPDGVENIASESFNLISGIKTLYIPASVKEIEEASIFSTFDLNEIVVDENNPYYKSVDGVLYTKDGKVLLAWPDDKKEELIIIPEGTERIGAFVFYGRIDKSYEVKIPEGVKELGEMSLPANITKLYLPNSLTKIDLYVFYNNMSIGEIIYDGTEEEWGNITVDTGNDMLGSVEIRKKY